MKNNYQKMPNKLEELFKQARSAKMDEKNKGLIRSEILRQMKETRLPLQNPFLQWMRGLKLKPVYISIFGLAVLVMSGIVSASAQSSLPGDTLYPVKVGVNEKIMQVLAFSEEAKISLNMKLAEVRLKEAEQLALEGKITEDKKQEIEKNFSEKTKKVAANLEALNEKKDYNQASEIASGFEASLKAHQEILEKIKQESPEAGQESKKLDSLVKEVDNAAKEANGSGQDSVQKQVVESAEDMQAELAQMRQKTAEDALADAREFLESQKQRISDKTIERAQEGLKHAEEKINEGKEKIKPEEKNYKEGIMLFQEAFTVSKQVIILIRTRLELRMNYYNLNSYPQS